MFKRKLKAILSLFLTLTICITSSSFAYANEISTSLFDTININGVNYKIIRDIDKSGDVTVTVITDDETTVLKNDGEKLYISKEINDIGEVYSDIIIIEEAKINLAPFASGSYSTPFWNYGYGWDDNYYNQYGYFWNLRSGNDNGNLSTFDEHNTTARSYAEAFKSNVHDIGSNHVAAIAAIGSAEAAGIAGGLASVASGGISLVIAFIYSLGAGIASAGYWVASYTASLDANYNFNAFKNALNY